MSLDLLFVLENWNKKQNDHLVRTSAQLYNVEEDFSECHNNLADKYPDKLCGISRGGVGCEEAGKYNVCCG
jgi:hypothetical protein